MSGPALSGMMRTRVILVVILAGAFVLLTLPVEVMTIVRGGSAGDFAVVFGLGIGLPALFVLVMMWQVRRWRSNPNVRRRQPNRAASRTMLFGNLGAITLGNVAQVAAGGYRGAAWPVGLGVTMIGVVIVFVIAKKQDPRMRYFRRPDPIPEGQEPDGPPERANGPW